jgi:hypothetical protein
MSVSGKPGKRRSSSRSMVFVVGVAVLLLVGAYMVPMQTSLGQGVSEHVVIGWRGAYRPVSHRTTFELLYNNGTYANITLGTENPADFSQHVSATEWVTPTDSVQSIRWAEQANPSELSYLLGTSNNAPRPFHPFAESPVAYSAALLRDLQKNNVNPKEFGGPNIVPGSVPIASLPSGELQIDTTAGGNKLAQCQPGQTPAALVRLMSAKKSS